MPISESDLPRRSSIEYTTQPGPGRRPVVNQPSSFQQLNTALNPFTRPSAPYVYIPPDARNQLRAIRIKVLGPARLTRNWFSERYDDALIAVRRTIVSSTTLGDIADLEPGTCTACLGTGKCPACKRNVYCSVCDGHKTCAECDGTGREDGVAR